MSPETRTAQRCHDKRAPKPESSDDTKTQEQAPNLTEPDDKLDALAHQVIGAAIEVHCALGPGYLESLYEEALCVELALRRITFARQVPVPVRYKNVVVGEGRIDLLVGARLVVELKTVDHFTPVHTAQVLSYLKTLRQPLGLLINFKVAVLRKGLRRVVLFRP